MLCILTIATSAYVVDRITGSVKDPTSGQYYSTYGELYASGLRRGGETGCPNIKPRSISVSVYVGGTYQGSASYTNTDTSNNRTAYYMMSSDYSGDIDSDGANYSIHTVYIGGSATGSGYWNQRVDENNNWK